MRITVLTLRVTLPGVHAFWTRVLKYAFVFQKGASGLRADWVSTPTQGPTDVTLGLGPLAFTAMPDAQGPLTGERSQPDEASEGPTGVCP